MAIDAARNIYVTGFEGSDQNNHLNNDAVTLKYAPDGTTEWVMPFNMQYEETAARHRRPQGRRGRRGQGRRRGSRRTRPPTR